MLKSAVRRGTGGETGIERRFGLQLNKRGRCSGVSIAHGVVIEQLLRTELRRAVKLLRRRSRRPRKRRKSGGALPAVPSRVRRNGEWWASNPLLAHRSVARAVCQIVMTCFSA